MLTPLLKFEVSPIKNHSNLKKETVYPVLALVQGDNITLAMLNADDRKPALIDIMDTYIVGVEAFESNKVANIKSTSTSNSMAPCGKEIDCMDAPELIELMISKYMVRAYMNDYSESDKRLCAKILVAQDIQELSWIVDTEQYTVKYPGTYYAIVDDNEVTTVTGNLIRLCLSWWNDVQDLALVVLNLSKHEHSRIIDWCERTVKPHINKIVQYVKETNEAEYERKQCLKADYVCRNLCCSKLT